MSVALLLPLLLQVNLSDIFGLGRGALEADPTGGNVAVSGLFLLVLFGMLLWRWGQPMELLLAFAIPFLFILGIFGVLPWWLGVLSGAAAFTLFAMGAMAAWAR